MERNVCGNCGHFIPSLDMCACEDSPECAELVYENSEACEKFLSLEGALSSDKSEIKKKMKKKAINMNPIGEIISKRLEERGMSQAELSRITKVSTPVINDIVKGRRGISPDQIVSFSLVLGLDALELGRMQSDYEIMQLIIPIMEKED